MQCSKCSSQDGEYKSGISKKNNKPWKGWKCASCNEMNWLPTEQKSQVQSLDVPAAILIELKKTNSLLAKLVPTQDPIINVCKTDEVRDDNTIDEPPF